jgi:hypothetical protein
LVLVVLAHQQHKHQKLLRRQVTIQFFQLLLRLVAVAQEWMT